MLRSQPFYTTFQSINFLCTCLHVHDTIHLNIHVSPFCVYVLQTITYTHETYKNEILANRNNKTNYKKLPINKSLPDFSSDQQPSQGAFKPLREGCSGLKKCTCQLSQVS